MYEAKSDNMPLAEYKLFTGNQGIEGTKGIVVFEGYRAPIA